MEGGVLKMTDASRPNFSLVYSARGFVKKNIPGKNPVSNTKYVTNRELFQILLSFPNMRDRAFAS